MLHLHGLMWMNGNARLSKLMQDLAEEYAGEYREKVLRFVDDVFTEVCLGKAARVVGMPLWPRTWLTLSKCVDLTKARETESSKRRSVVDYSLESNESSLRERFKEEANERGAKQQMHLHTETCRRKGKEGDADWQCRFNAPWPLVEETHFRATPVPVLRIKRNHPMVAHYAELGIH